MVGKGSTTPVSVVPADAPESVKKVLRTNYSSFFGPAGILEQEDSEVWSQQFLGSEVCQACHPEGDVCLTCHSARTGLRFNPHPKDWDDMKDRIRDASDGRTCRKCH